jgi:transcriptional regulator with XRE-family HTH domain
VCADFSPTVRRLRLAAELRRLRDEVGLTGDEVAEGLGWSPSKVSRYELARTGLKPADVRTMLDFYGVDTRRQVDLITLANEATRKGWWEDYGDTLAEDYIHIVGLEAEASSEWSWHLEVIPGLLQTQAYARQINSRGQFLRPTPPGQLDRSVQIRMRRQELLTSKSPLEFRAVIDEAVLSRRLASAPVMREQLDHLLAVAQLPNVSVRILRLEDNWPVIINSFDLLVFETDSSHKAVLPDVVWTEHPTGALYSEDEAETYQYRLVFNSLSENSLEPASSMELIARTAARMLRTSTIVTV